MKSALVFGYYGYDNLGDELLCQATLDLLRSNRFDKMYLLVPKRKMKDYEQKYVRPVNRFDPISVLKALLHSNYVICGGGGIFQDQTSLRSFIYYSSIVMLSLFFRKPVILLANSLGPVKREFSRKILRYLLSRKKVFLIARDNVSARYAKRFSKNVVEGTDLAIMVLRKIAQDHEKKPQATFCLKSPIDLSQILSLMKYIGIRRFVLAPLSPQDGKISQNLLSQYHELELSSDPIHDIASSSIVISQRMHGCLISAYFGVPFVAVNNSKATRFMRRYLPRYSGYTSENPSEIVIAASKVLGESLNIKERLLMDSQKMEEDFVKVLKSLRSQLGT
ncbi:MAG: polysaccharide pyruvyl transferase family protein [Pseudothermotoga sp.]